MQIRPASCADFEAVLALNEESVQYLSPLDRARLELLHSLAHQHLVVSTDDAVIAFMLLFRENSRYDSTNYQWFDQQFDSFLYVDRIVVKQGIGLRGLGTKLYESVFALADSEKLPRVVCEIDIEPPNPASLRFHQKFGFKEIGSQTVANGSKVVSLQSALVAPRSSSGSGDDSVRLVTVEPTLPALAVLLAESDALMARLYPQESVHLAGVDDLAGPDALVLGCYVRDDLVGCGAVKFLSDDGEYGELKRVYVLAEHRGRGYSRQIVSGLEAELSARNLSLMRLETGVHQPEAIGLYKSMGYQQCSPYGIYQTDPLSVFMEKKIKARE